jgi:hypothetical protein
MRGSKALSLGFLLGSVSILAANAADLPPPAVAPIYPDLQHAVLQPRLDALWVGRRLRFGIRRDS